MFKFPKIRAKMTNLEIYPETRQNLRQKWHKQES